MLEEWNPSLNYAIQVFSHGATTNQPIVPSLCLYIYYVLVVDTVYLDEIWLFKYIRIIIQISGQVKQNKTKLKRN